LSLLSERAISARVVPLQQVSDADIDVAIFSKTYDEAELNAAVRLSHRGVKVILDLCDNHLVSHPTLPHLTQRRERLLKMIGVVDLVTCSTPTLAAVIPIANVEVVEDLLEKVTTPFWGGGLTTLLSYSFWNRPATDSLRLIWFGHSGADFPPFGLCDVGKALPVLARLNRAVPLTLTVVSNSREQFNRFVPRQPFPTEYVSWRSWMMPHLLRRHHACIIPVTDNEFTRCKSANRPAFALRCGIPVVAEPIPSYRELADFIELGDLELGLRHIIKDIPLAFSKVEKGRVYLDRRFSASCVAGQWETAIFRALSTSTRSAGIAKSRRTIGDTTKS
jgi:hypothetical protein